MTVPGIQIYRFASMQDSYLNFDASRRFGALDRLYGPSGARTLTQAHVLVVGVGGVGSWSVESLARSAVGAISMIDMDHISESNVNRQIHALTNTIGQSKALAMKERIYQINPSCHVNIIDDFVSPDNWLDFLKKLASMHSPVNGVIDACDQLSAKLAIASWAISENKDKKIPIITIGAAGGKTQAHKVDISDLSKATHDPLLSQLRSRLRRDFLAPSHGKHMGLTCLFSAESVKQPDKECSLDSGMPDGTLNCHGYGSSVSVTSTFGHCAAGWICDELAKHATT